MSTFFNRMYICRTFVGLWDPYISYEGINSLFKGSKLKLSGECDIIYNGINWYVAYFYYFLIKEAISIFKKWISTRKNDQTLVSTLIIRHLMFKVIATGFC